MLFTFTSNFAKEASNSTFRKIEKTKTDKEKSRQNAVACPELRGLLVAPVGIRAEVAPADARDARGLAGAVRSKSEASNNRHYMKK